MPKLVIFDLDGTLLNTIYDLSESCNYILEKYKFPTHSITSYKKFVGSGISNLIETALPKSEREPLFIKQLKKEFIEYYSQHSEDKTTPYPGVIDMLNKLHEKKIKLAVASNKFIEGTQSLVNNFFEQIPFVSVLGQREGVPVKPDPQIIFDIMAETNINEKDQILYVGDTDSDMITATNAEIEGVGALWGFRSKEELISSGAKYLAEEPLDIIKIVKGKLEAAIN